MFFVYCAIVVCRFMLFVFGNCCWLWFAIVLGYSRFDV